MTIDRETCPSPVRKLVTHHVLRHTAPKLLLYGVDHAAITPWLGHESVETTSVNLHEDLRLKQAGMAKTDSVQVPPTRCRPEDHVMVFLNSLGLFPVECRIQLEPSLPCTIKSQY